jgi:Ca-activated chloride channel family protein
VTLLDGALKVSITANPAPTPPIRIHLTCDLIEEQTVDPPPAKILTALSRLTLFRMQERAQSAAEAGEYSDAARHLQNLATHLLARGEQGLAKTALLEAENLERMHAFSDGGSKEIKYRTRALLLDGPRAK